jgi:DivIVA domain-containing protein
VFWKHSIVDPGDGMNSPHARTSDDGLTAKEIRAVRFTRTSLGWRGYAVEEVDKFVAEVADTLAEAEREQAALRAEVDRLRDFYRNQGVDVDRPRQAMERHRLSHRLYDRIIEYTWVQLDLAQEFASLLPSAPEEADTLLYHARVRASLAAEQAVFDAAKDTNGGAVDREEMREIVVWLRALGYAMQVQVDGTTDALRSL